MSNELWYWKVILIVCLNLIFYSSTRFSKSNTTYSYLWYWLYLGLHRMCAVQYWPAATCMGASACGASFLLAKTSSGTRRPNMSGWASSSSSSSRATTVQDNLHTFKCEQQLRNLTVARGRSLPEWRQWIKFGASWIGSLSTTKRAIIIW